MVAVWVTCYWWNSAVVDAMRWEGITSCNFLLPVVGALLRLLPSLLRYSENKQNIELFLLLVSVLRSSVRWRKSVCVENREKRERLTMDGLDRNYGYTDRSPSCVLARVFFQKILLLSTNTTIIRQTILLKEKIWRHSEQFVMFGSQSKLWCVMFFHKH